jgi:hypothetical protein
VNPSKINRGIPGVVQIARKNWKAIHLSRGSIVMTVASCDEERSGRFIMESQSRALMKAIPDAFGRCEDWLACEA